NVWRLRDSNCAPYMVKVGGSRNSDWCRDKRRPAVLQKPQAMRRRRAVRQFEDSLEQLSESSPSAELLEELLRRNMLDERSQAAVRFDIRNSRLVLPARRSCLHVCSVRLVAPTADWLQSFARLDGNSSVGCSTSVPIDHLLMSPTSSGPW